MVQADMYCEFAADIAVKAGRFIKENSGKIQSLTYKGEVDLVTDIDKKAQDMLTKRIQEKFPDHSITAEEQCHLVGASQYRWIIDPIDGTTNFVHGYPFYCVSIALEKEGSTVMGVVYNPCMDELFTAGENNGAFLNGKPIYVSICKSLKEALVATGFSYAMRERKICLQEYMDIFQIILSRTQGLRRDGTAALDLCSVACGRLDGFFEEGLKEWDTAAGALIVKEAGGRVTDFFGSAANGHSSTTLASNALLHRELEHITKHFPCCQSQ